jgi:glyoxylase-like metal-dependent hydrolase (beta-lactamase superfamily II)
VSGSAAAGIHHIPLPTPFPVGDVNTYLIEDDPLVLVDCGPNWGTAMGVLEQSLDSLGHSLDDLGLLLLTHHHPDHLGLAAEIKRRTGVEIASLDQTAVVAEDWEAWRQQNDDDVRLAMMRHGVESSMAEALHAESSMRGWGSSVPVDRRLHEGDSIPLRDRELVVFHRPGHSATDTVFLDQKHRVLIAGDHLLAGISSNAVVSRPVGPWDGRRPRTLLTYRDSLAKTREMDVDLVLGGHGPPITDHGALIDERLAAQDERAARILELLEPGPRNAHQVATGLFGSEIAVTQAYATLSESLGHLDLLIERDQAVENRDDSVITFEGRAG